MRTSVVMLCGIPKLPVDSSLVVAASFALYLFFFNLFYANDCSLSPSSPLISWILMVKYPMTSPYGRPE